uniref:FYVE, RhoGEF and PH domain-containing protein 6 n=1 Tax=Sphaerodactylus townsendi TaxID=933632 RepID=A0ACB8FP07_9SAUR
MYSTYVKEFDKNVALLDEQCKKKETPVLLLLFEIFEMSPRCTGLALKHYLLKPVQRDPSIQAAFDRIKVKVSEYMFSRPSTEDPDDSGLMLGDLHSDEEIISRDVNSSDDEDDDDDSNSDSSKGEHDTQENNQAKAAGKKTKVYHIAKEIMSSEKVFVDVLKLLHIDFRDSVAHATRQLGKPVIEDRILNQILYYLPQLYELNRDLLRELEERLTHWVNHQRIADIFVRKGPYLKMYSTYIKEFDKNVALLDEQCKKNPSFAAVVRDFEMSPRCASLALKHYLLKPVQRIPQYRLLLTGKC